MNTKAPSIKNRIIKQGLFDWQTAKWFQPKEFKRQTKDEHEKIKRSMIDNGFLSPFFVWERGKQTFILDGHGRAAILREIEAEGIAVPKRLPGVWIDVADRADAVRLVLIYNSRYGKIRDGELDGFVDGLDIESLRLHIQIPEIRLTLPPINGHPQAPRTQPSPTTKPGDLYILGSSRLICADSRDSAAVSMLMDGKKAKLFCTDPPYGVNYSAVKDGIPRSGFRTMVADHGNMESDDLADKELQDFLETVFRNAAEHCENAAWYLWHAHLTQGFFAAAAAAAANVILHRQIIWVKSHMVLTRSGHYHWKHEPCFYGWVKGKRPQWLGDKNQTSVWDFPHYTRETDHPTEKPKELFAIPIHNHLHKGEICLDLFAGSGTQIMVAEELERACYAAEISPAYCDVIDVDRWETLTGKTAERIKGAAI